MLKVGQAITYVDTYQKPRPALVVHVGMPDNPETWINLVFVNSDENQSDTYGRKVDRATSVGPKREGWTGNYWVE